MLELIANQHKHWIKVVNHYGEHEMAEDIVQEMYLKINKYLDRAVTDGEVNGGYVRFVLMTMTYDYKKYKQKIDKFSIGDGFDIEQNVNLDDWGYGRFLRRLDQEINSWDDFDKKVFKLYVGTYGTQNIKTHGLKVSIRRFSKESGISIMTIFKTLKHCKQRIKDNCHEHWEDYRNEEHERN